MTNNENEKFSNFSQVLDHIYQQNPNSIKFLELEKKVNALNKQIEQLKTFVIRELYEKNRKTS